MARAHGKAIVLGEHGVVYGRPALAAALDRGVVATARLSTDGAGPSLHVAPWDVTVTPSATSTRDLDRAFHALLEGYREPPAVVVEARTELPGGAGLGSSAALSVAVLRAIDETLGIERTTAEVVACSLAWERVFHGSPSGIDSALAAEGGVLVYRKGEAPTVVHLPRPLRLCVGDTSERSSTRAMVESVARLRERNRPKIELVFDSMAALVRNGHLALEAGDSKALGQLMDLNQALLASLMLSTETVESMCDAARKAGALGAKVTGAGGGGCVIAVAPGHEDDVVAAWRSLGKDAWISEVDTHGAHRTAAVSRESGAGT